MAPEHGYGLRRYLQPHRRTIAFTIVLLIVAVIAEIASISILKPLMNEGVYGDDLNDILYMGAILLILTIIYSAFQSYSSYVASKITAAVSHDMREDIIKSILKKQRLSSKGSTTNAMTCLTTDVNTVQSFLFETLRTYIQLPILIIALLLCTYYMVFDVGVMLTIIFIVVIVISIFLSERFSKYYMGQLSAIDDVNSQLRQKITGARTIRAYNGKEYEEKKFQNYNSRLGSFNRKVTLNSYYIPNFISALVWISVVFIYTYAALETADQEIFPTELVLFMQYTSLFVTTLAIVPYITIGYPKFKASLSRISDTLDLSDDDTEKFVESDSSLAVSIKGLTLIDSLGKKSLDNVSIDIRKGEKVSIIGPNGSGGYNIAMTILGFNRPLSGEVSVCGLDALRSSPEMLRPRISYVSNSINILEGTMRFNLDPHSQRTDEEIMEVCTKLGLDSFIDDLPNGLDTIVNDNRNSISGGQKQMVLIARAILKDPELYIFENCFYSIDPITRGRIMKTAMEMCQDKTVLFIMNDTYTCDLSTNIILMDRGTVSDIGEHDQLLKRSELYSKMYHAGQGREGTWA